jgi:AraC-like DNA-binding protein
VKKTSKTQAVDVNVLGADTVYAAVLSNGKNTPGWLSKSPISRELSQHHIAHAGVMKARAPYEIVRYDQSGTFLMACLDGEGEVLRDGDWLTITAGQACLLPPFVKNAFRCKPGKKWVFAWVRYLESREISPVVSVHSPVFGMYKGEPLLRAIEGLRAEALAEAMPASMGLWADLIHGYVMRFAQPHKRDSRLWKLWKAVEKDPAHDWSLTELAEAACVSREHLRRICLKELGRSAIQQVTFIRMQIAARMLATGDEKIETVCRAVGFKSPQSFSNTFLKWIGRRPSEHRA